MDRRPILRGDATSLGRTGRLSDLGLEVVEQRNDGGPGAGATTRRWAAEALTQLAYPGSRWLLHVEGAEAGRYVAEVATSEAPGHVEVHRRGWGRSRTTVLAMSVDGPGALVATVEAAAATSSQVTVVAVGDGCAAGDLAAALAGGREVEVLAEAAAVLRLDSRTACGSLALGRAGAGPSPGADPARRPRPAPAQRHIAAISVALVLLGAVAAIAFTRSAPPRSAPSAAVSALGDTGGPPPRGAPAFTYDSVRRAVLMFGGFAPVDGTILGDTWTQQGPVWQPHEVAPAPSRRESGILVDDPKRQVVVLLGGYGPGGEGPLADSWGWDGSTWRQLHALAGPGPQPALLPAAAWDPSTQAVLLVGVCRDGTAVDVQTWTWDGVWHRARPVHEPVLASSAVLAFHHGTQRLVLVDAGNAGRGDTWTWDGRDWSLLPVAGPAYDPLSARLAEDPVTGRVVLTSAPGATWTWDGTSWRDLRPAQMPRTQAGLIDDGRSLVLVGGPSKTEDLGRWRFTGTSWRPQP